MKKKLLLGLAVIPALMLGGLTIKTNVTFASPSVTFTNKSSVNDVRAYFIAELDKVDLSIYREAQKVEVSNLINEVKTRLNNATTLNQLDAIYSSFSRYVLTIKTDAQLTEEENQPVIEEKVFRIANEDDLVEFQQDVNNGFTYQGYTVLLDEDITLTSHWTTGIGITTANSFKGIFDGQNHTISNLYIRKSTGCTALFGNAIDATIKNLKLSNVYIESTDSTASTSQRTAGIVGRAERDTIENVHVLSGTIKGSQENGGIAGVAVNGITIKNCSNGAGVTGTGPRNAGILGYLYSGTGYIENCVNNGSVKCNGLGAGGILASNVDKTLVQISNCTNNGTVTNTSGGRTGGIVGILRVASSSPYTTKSTITNCTNNADVTGSDVYSGAITGTNRGSVTDCSAKKGIKINNVVIENITGGNDAEIERKQFFGAEDTGGTHSNCVLVD